MVLDLGVVGACGAVVGYRCSGITMRVRGLEELGLAHGVVYDLY